MKQCTRDVVHAIQANAVYDTIQPHRTLVALSVSWSARTTVRRRKELAEGKTSKVALDDCNFRSPSSRGKVPAGPSRLPQSKMVARRRQGFQGYN